MAELYQEKTVNAKIKFSTVKRLEKILDRPIMRGFDKHFNEVLDNIEGNYTPKCARCKKIIDFLLNDNKEQM